MIPRLPIAYSVLLIGLAATALDARAEFPASYYLACAERSPGDRERLLEAARRASDQATPVPPRLTAATCATVAMDAVLNDPSPANVMRPGNLERALERSYPRP
jgi:hypothetical protein